MFPKKTLHFVFLAALLVAGIILTACNANPPNSQTPLPAQTEAVTAAPQITVEQPSSTPPPAQVWLVVPEGAESIAEQITPWLEQKATSQNLVLEIHPPADLNNPPANLRLAIFAAPDAQTSNWTDRFPDAGLIILNDDSSEASQNVSVIRSAPIQQAFIAGFITTLVAPDFRSAALFNQNDPRLNQLQDSFQNGGRYLCGRCTPVFAPIVFFPLTGTFNPAGGAPGWITSFDALHQNRLETLFLSDPVLLDPQFLETISGQNVAFVTTQTPPEEWRSQWIATLEIDLLSALEKAWENWQNGGAGASWQAGVRIADYNPDRLTEGKLNLTLKTLKELEDGWIYPLSIP